MCDNDEQGFQFSKVVTVHIISGVPNILELHCKSKDDDFGTPYFRTDLEFSWKFGPNFSQVTLYFCYFKWDSKARSFAVYNRKLRRFCKFSLNPYPTCYWATKPNGFYISVCSFP
ncbi:S-protein homolog 5-like [Rhododendron vialii]|uniref:S-protein homolog 5-like n=1 Tax=Rhododendron vialii TaxID=182163 RepID=UPI00265E6C94|nr:S-protein homolog 5-like [Rhododendron vialii]